MTVYKWKTRNLSEKPTTVELVDTNHDAFGTIDVLYRDSASLVTLAKVKSARDKLSKRDLGRLEKPETEADYEFVNGFWVRFHVENYVAGSAIIGEDEKAMKHDNEMLIAFLSQENMTFAFDAILAVSFDVANFRRAKEDETKNV